MSGLMCADNYRVKGNAWEEACCCRLIITERRSITVWSRDRFRPDGCFRQRGRYSVQ